MFTHPHLPVARVAAYRYLTESKENMTGTALFNWPPARPPPFPPPTFQVSKTDPTILFVQAILDKMGKSKDFPPPNSSDLWMFGYGHDAEEGQAEDSNLHRLVRWICCEEWKDLPEFCNLRDIIFIARMALEPRPMLMVNNPQM